RRRVAPILTLLLLVAVAAAGWRLGWVEQWLTETPSTAPVVLPARPEPWESVVPDPEPVADPADPAVPDADAIAAALRPVLEDHALGGRVLAEVAPLLTDPSPEGAGIFTLG